MKLKLTITCGMMMLAWAVAAQHDNRIQPPRLAVKWSPLHLAYFYPSLQIALEHRVYKNVSLQYDAGIILPYRANDTEEYSNKHGFRGMLELRYYFPDSPPKIPFYVAGEFFYSRATFDRSQVIGRGCEGGECDYYQYTTSKVYGDHTGGGLKFGILLYPGWNKNRSFFFDLNGGIGVHEIIYTHNGLPSAPDVMVFEPDTKPFISPSERNRIEPRVIIGVRIGYDFLHPRTAE